MKIISPDVTVYIPDFNGVPRSPGEGPFTVTNEYADHLLKAGTLTKDQIEDVAAAKAGSSRAKQEA